MEQQALNTTIHVETAIETATDGSGKQQPVVLLTTETSVDRKQAITAVLDMQQTAELIKALTKAIEGDTSTDKQ